MLELQLWMLTLFTLLSQLHRNEFLQQKLFTLRASRRGRLEAQGRKTGTSVSQKNLTLEFGSSEPRNGMERNGNGMESNGMEWNGTQ